MCHVLPHIWQGWEGPLHFLLTCQLLHSVIRHAAFLHVLRELPWDETATCPRQPGSLWPKQPSLRPLVLLGKV